MMNAFKALIGGFICSTLTPASAFAAPNVFWTFGFDREYNLGTGGRAQLSPEVMLAATRRSDHDDGVYDASSGSGTNALSQKLTVAAREVAKKKTVGDRS